METKIYKQTMRTLTCTRVLLTFREVDPTPLLNSCNFQIEIHIL